MSTPFMQLDLPSPLVTLGPTWASMLNAALGQVDSHDHTSGQGVPITPAALDINADLDFQGHAALNVQAVNLATLAAALAAPSQLQSVNGDLVWVNANGTQVPITSGNAVVGSPGNIQNLVAPASAQYVIGTLAFQWLSSSGVVAGLDAGRLDLRENSSSTGPVVTIRAAAAGVSTHTLIAPLAVPLGSGGALTGRASGANVSMGYAYLDNTTLEEAIVGGNYTWRIKNGGVAGTYSGITPTAQVAYRGLTTEALAELAVTTGKINNGAVQTAKLADAPNGVTVGKINDGAVQTAKLADAPNGVTVGKINDGAVQTAKLANAPNGVTTAKINDGAVTPVKMTSTFRAQPNGFTATNATLNATQASPYIIATTAAISIPAEKLYTISLQGDPVVTGLDSGELFFRNVGAADYSVYLQLKLTSASLGLTRNYRYRLLLSAGGDWQSFNALSFVCDRHSVTIPDAVVEASVFTTVSGSSFNAIRFYLNYLILFVGV